MHFLFNIRFNGSTYCFPNICFGQLPPIPVPPRYEPGTAFGRRWPVAGETGRPGEAAAAALYETTHWELEKLGFEHYAARTPKPLVGW